MMLLYLGAIVLANLLAARYGPAVTVLSAFLLIGCSYTVRDVLHERWRGHLRVRMALLIWNGALLSWVVNPAAARVAAASAVAFACAETVDALAYQAAGRRPWLVKVNASNVAGAAVDSVIFPTLAFGALLPWVVAGQFVAKVAGGAVWAYLLRRRR